MQSVELGQKSGERFQDIGTGTISVVTGWRHFMLVWVCKCERRKREMDCGLEPRQVSDRGSCALHLPTVCSYCFPTLSADVSTAIDLRLQYKYIHRKFSHHSECVVVNCGACLEADHNSETRVKEAVFSPLLYQELSAFMSSFERPSDLDIALSPVSRWRNGLIILAYMQ
jgi:hypothetical protein